jgi:transposase
MLRRVRVDGQPIARVAREHGYSRPTFYQAQEAFEREGVSGLLPRKRGPRRAHKLSGEVMQFVGELLIDDPSLTASGLVERIYERFRVHVHPRSVERALKRKKGGS